MHSFTCWRLAAVCCEIQVVSHAARLTSTVASATRTEHGPARVDDLQLAVAGKGLRVSREACGVPAVVSGVLSCREDRSKQQG
jgi:hypothetical protein